MRTNYRNRTSYTLSDLKRMRSDALHNMRRANTDAAYARNFEEYRALQYAIYYAVYGKSPNRGRPSQLAKSYLARLGRN